MKSFNFFKTILLATFASFLFTSCGDDVLNPNVVKPTVDFVAGTGIVTSDVIVDLGAPFTVNLVGKKGDNSMSSVLINEADTKVSLDRISIAGLSSFGNAILLTQDLKSAFDFKITITAHTSISTKAYSFVITDDSGNSTTKSINVTTVGNPPLITQPESNQMVDIKPDSLFGTNFQVTKGSSDLNSIEFLINDVPATDLSRIFYSQLMTPVTTNPFILSGADQTALNKDIYFRAPTTPGVYKYTIKFIDAVGQSSSKDITATVGTKVGSLEGLLLNQSGPSGQGGLDLDTGKSTNTDPSKPDAITAEIRDEGIVNILTDQTWKQQISGMNGSVIKYIKKGVNGISENFNFTNIEYKEEISGLWGNGVDFTLKSTDQLREVSDKVAVGDIFIVKNGTKYYLIMIKDIKITTTDNKDSYTMDVKF